jgi:hypothetical protein
MPKKGKDFTTSSQGELSDKRAVTPIRPSTAPPPTGQIIGVKDRLKSWLPADNKSFFFELVTLVCLIVGVINFVTKGDTTIVLQVLVFVAGYVGIGSFLSKWKGKDQ